MTLVDLLRQQQERSVVAVQGIGQRPIDVAFAPGRTTTIGDGVAFDVEGKQRPAAPAAQTEAHAVLTRSQLNIVGLIETT